MYSRNYFPRFGKKVGMYLRHSWGVAWYFSNSFSEKYFPKFESGSTQKFVPNNQTFPLTSVPVLSAHGIKEKVVPNSCPLTANNNETGDFKVNSFRILVFGLKWSHCFYYLLLSKCNALTLVLMTVHVEGTVLLWEATENCEGGIDLVLCYVFFKMNEIEVRCWKFWEIALLKFVFVTIILSGLKLNCSWFWG